MPKILIISSEKELSDKIDAVLKKANYETKIVNNETTAIAITKDFLPDIAIVDSQCCDSKIASICKKLKLQGQNNDIQIILITGDQTSKDDALVTADGFITKPFSDAILFATVNAHLRIKKLLDILYTNNSELAKSLYQLNVLYNTSSQLAGTLDKARLIDILSEGLEKSLSYTLCSTLVTNNQQDARLIIKSLHPITERLEQALMLRAMVGYKSLFDSVNLPFELSMDNITVEKHSKHKEGQYDLEILNYDKLFAPISTSDKFFGTVEIIREIELTGEDSTCFQTLVKQVSLPLESAILYEEIKETNIKLEKLEKMKSEFISIVSHELRTPLTAIKNSLDIMLSGKTGETTEAMNKFLNMAKRNVTRLSGIINDLLDLSKIEAGKMQYRFEGIDIKDPIEFVKNTFENLAAQKHIVIDIDIENNLKRVYADNNRLEQVLTNLISNAIKFTSENGKIQISAETISAKDIDLTEFYRLTDQKLKFLMDCDYVKISIKDNGIGIKQEDIPKVFDKFQQIESSLSRNVGGTGLGLPIAKELIDAHRGEIWLESEEQKGSTFAFILPVMSNTTNFILELDNELKNSKYNHYQSTLLTIETDESTFSEEINENRIECIKDLKKKVFTYKNNNKIVIQTLFIDCDKYKAKKTVTEIKEFIKENKTKYTNNSFSIGYAIYPADAITGEELIEQAKNSLSYLSIEDTEKEPHVDIEKSSL